jgi:hypothetical protein
LGKLNKTSASTKGRQQLELLYCTFDRAGPDVPEVLEMVRTPEKDEEFGRVLRFTIAEPSH